MSKVPKVSNLERAELGLKPRGRPKKVAAVVEEAPKIEAPVASSSTAKEKGKEKAPKVPKAPKAKKTVKFVEQVPDSGLKRAVDPLKPVSINRPIAYINALKTYHKDSSTKRGTLENIEPSTIYANHENIYKSLIKIPSINTRKTHLSALVDSLKRVEGYAEFNDIGKLARKYSEEASELDQANQKIQKENLPIDSRKNNIITMDIIKKKLYDLLAIKNPTFANRLDTLALSFNVLMPPLRGEIADIMIYEKDPEKKDINYIVVKDDSINLVLNDYKTYKKYGRKIILLPFALSHYIRESLELYPRKYLLSKVSDVNTALGYQDYKNRLEELFNEKSFGVDAIRSAYVTDFFESNPTENEIEDLAAKMLTSPGELRKSYRKVPLKPSKEKPAKVEEMIAETIGEQVPKTPREKRLSYYMEYYKENRPEKNAYDKARFQEKKAEIYKQRIIRQLKEDRKSGISTVKKSSILKYKITEADLE